MSLSKSYLQEFRQLLLHWYTHSKRDLPWRRNRDPYAVWVSEIMLQQTRVAAAIPYYERFLTRFPDFQTLAGALEADLLAHWAGLGYYYRARNLQKAAVLMTKLDRFPDSYAEILALPGVGDYTAAAVASISFNLPHAVLDGNVYRVLSRIANDATNIATTAGKKRFTALADELLDHESPGDYNQALMELGATICLPKNPQCLVCPVVPLCEARAAGRQNDLPVKTKPKKSVEEHRTLFWIEKAGALLLWQRPPESRLMPGFWEFPEAGQLTGVMQGEKIGSFNHGITVHNYRFDVMRCEVPDDIGRCQWISEAQLAALPLSTIMRKAIKAVERSRLRSQTAGA